MKLNEFKERLEGMSTFYFQLENGEKVPSHFHVTEVGKVKKEFIDCGGTIRSEEVVNLQLWSATDYNHRLRPDKLISIIKLSQDKLSISDLPIEVEYQGETIGKYGIEFIEDGFLLTTKKTACLALESCVSPVEKVKMGLKQIASSTSCAPGSGCC